jgi:hypothetical protein
MEKEIIQHIDGLRGWANNLRREAADLRLKAQMMDEFAFKLQGEADRFEHKLEQKEK